MRVFARKGYHTCRVGDIAEEAGVAHGLLYHYFRSKEELLETIFRETWRDVLDAVRSVEETDERARDRLAGIAKILLRAWRRDPDLVRVLVREVTRSAAICARRVINASVMPSTKKSCAGSPMRFWSGSTATDLIRGGVSGLGCSTSAMKR